MIPAANVDRRGSQVQPRQTAAGLVHACGRRERPGNVEVDEGGDGLR